MTASQAIVALLQIQAKHAARSYQRQVLEQMYDYSNDPKDFNLLSLL
jgi:hypothetical protein